MKAPGQNVEACRMGSQEEGPQAGMWVQTVDGADTIPRLIFDHPHQTPRERLFSIPCYKWGN